jgi:hypothetical protein
VGCAVPHEERCVGRKPKRALERLPGLPDDLAARTDAIEASAAINARLVATTDAERQAAVAKVTSALVHPILQAWPTAASGARRPRTL